LHDGFKIKKKIMMQSVGLNKYSACLTFLKNQSRRILAKKQWKSD
jgi:hypothetical protein